MASKGAAEATSEGAGEMGETGEQVPPLLAIYLSEQDVSQMGASGGESGYQPTVLRSSTILLNPTVLDAISPHEVQVKEMPIVRVELFNDLVVDVEFVSAKPKWKSGMITYDGEGTPTDVEMVKDGFLIRGKLLEPHSGYIVLRGRNDAISIGAVSVDGIGSIEIQSDVAPLHTANLIVYPNSAFEVVLAEQAMGMMSGLGGCPNPTGCPGGCDDGCTIDMMMLYTDAAQSYFESLSQNIEDAIDVRIDQVNAYLTQSEIVGHDLLRIVFIGKVDYDESNQSTADALGALGNGFSPLFAPIHTLRNAVNADLGQLWVHGTSGASGVAGAPFSAVKQSYDPLTVAHEIGHCFGLHHDRFVQCTCTACPKSPCDACNDCSCSPSDLGWGWHFTSVDGQHLQNFRTIMAYGTADSDYPCCFPDAVRVGYFSNPEVHYPAGDRPPTGSACANSARTIRGDANLLGTRFRVARNRFSHDTSNTTQGVRSIAEGPCYDVTLPDDDSESPSISANGQDITFASAATNVPPGIQKNNSARDVFFFDSEAGTVQLVSHVSQDLKTANGDSFSPAMSGNRRYIAFASTATDVVPEGKGITDPQIYLYNRRRESSDPLNDKVHTLVSRASDTPGDPPTPGDPAEGDCDRPAVNYDGTQIAFEVTGDADNIVPQSFTRQQIAVRNLDHDTTDTGVSETHLVSVSTSGAVGNEYSFNPAISATGRFVAFESLATNLAPGATDVCGSGNDEPCSNIFLRDRQENGQGAFDQSGNVITGRITTAFDDVLGEPVPNGHSHAPSISADGNRIAFHSYATNLVDGVTINAVPNVYLYDRVADTITIISVAEGDLDASANAGSRNASISPCGNFVTFESEATDLVTHAGFPANPPAESQIYVAYLLCPDQMMWLESVAPNGDLGDGPSTNAVISAHGRYVAFESEATNLDADTTPTADLNVFVRDRGRFRFGDLNEDGIVDQKDYDILAFQWGPCECCVADLNGDGVVDMLDLILMDLQPACQVP